MRNVLGDLKWLFGFAKTSLLSLNFGFLSNQLNWQTKKATELFKSVCLSKAKNVIGFFHVILCNFDYVKSCYFLLLKLCLSFITSFYQFSLLINCNFVYVMPYGNFLSLRLSYSRFFFVFESSQQRQEPTQSCKKISYDVFFTTLQL